MWILSLLNQSEVQVVGIRRIRAATSKGRKDKSKRRKAGKNGNRDRVGKYDLMKELARAMSGLAFGELARGDADGASCQLWKILKLSRGHELVAEELLAQPKVAQGG